MGIRVNAGIAPNYTTSARSQHSQGAHRAAGPQASRFSAGLAGHAAPKFGCCTDIIKAPFNMMGGAWDFITTQLHHLGNALQGAWHSITGSVSGMFGG